MLKLEIYTAFRGSQADCYEIWDAWEKRTGKRLSPMLLHQYASMGGLYWNGHKLVPESCPTEDVVLKDKDFFMKWLLPHPRSLEKYIREALASSDVAYTNKLEQSELDELAEAVMEAIEKFEDDVAV